MTKNSAHEAADRALQEVLNRLPHEKVRVVDVETSGLDWKRQAIVGYAIAFGPKPTDTYYVPFRHAGNANVGGHTGLISPNGWNGKLAPGEKELVQALDQQGTLVIGHKLLFDLKFMSRVGFSMKPSFEDTAVNEPILDEYAYSYDLEDCADRHKVQAKKKTQIVAYLRSKFPEIKSDREAMGHYWRLAGNDPMAVEYAQGDGTTTWQLRDAQMFEIRKEETYNGKPVPTLEKVWNIESRLIPVLARMMTRGIKIDEERLETITSEIDQRLERLYNEFPVDFNCRSPNDVRAWMERHACTDWPMTARTKRFPNGQPSFKEVWLETNDPGNKVLGLRKLEDLKSKFILPLRDTHMFKGRVHTNFNQLKTDDYGTVTARLSSNDPNLHAVMKHDEERGRLYRSAFVADDGMIWGDDDYSQCEPRLLAYYTNCKVLMHDYLNNPKADAHMAVTLAINAGRNLSPAEIKKYRNDFGKRINQTLITGGGKDVLVDKYKIPRNQIDKVWSDYFRAMPEIQPFQRRSGRLYKQRGYMISLLQRRARLDDPGRSYTALNRLLQVGNADIIKVKMVEGDEYLQSEGGDKCGVQMLLNCHDATSTQFREESRPIYNELLRIMQDFSSEGSVIRLPLPMPMDHGEGPSWDIATYGPEDKQ